MLLLLRLLLPVVLAAHKGPGNLLEPLLKRGNVGILLLQDRREDVSNMVHTNSLQAPLHVLGRTLLPALRYNASSSLFTKSGSLSCHSWVTLGFLAANRR